jgi:hypothetical protein
VAGYEDMILKTDSVELYEDDVDQAISEACEKFKVEDLVKEGQTRWKAVLHFVGKRLFPDRKVLRDKKVVWIDGNSIPTNNNRYDYYIINMLCDYYIQLSRSYNKLISSVAFAEFIVPIPFILISFPPFHCVGRLPAPVVLCFHVFFRVFL